MIRRKATWVRETNEQSGEKPGEDLLGYVGRKRKKVRKNRKRKISKIIRVL
jgi:hypothetical protein